jgi:hypothetical protein
LQVAVSVARTVRIDAARCPYPLIESGSLLLLRGATAALCKSGTTTLEAAVAGCPMIVAYRTNPLTYEIARRVVEIPRIGLVNVVAGREVAREFVQGACNQRRWPTRSRRSSARLPSGGAWWRRWDAYAPRSASPAPRGAWRAWRARCFRDGHRSRRVRAG